MAIEPTQNPLARAVGATDAISAIARASRQAAPAETQDALAIGADTIEISDQARELARAQQAVDASSDVRSDRVAQIRKRVEDGTYSVPADLLAQKLLDSWSHGR